MKYFNRGVLVVVLLFCGICCVKKNNKDFDQDSLLENRQEDNSDNSDNGKTVLDNRSEEEKVRDAVTAYYNDMNEDPPREYLGFKK